MRRGDWEAALVAYVAGTAEREHAWGLFDCALDAANAVEAMTGIDFAAPFRGRYSTAAGAARILRRFGKGTVEQTVDDLFPAIAPGFARRGDLVLHEGAIGVVMGGFALVLVENASDAGATRVRVPRHQWQKAWAVG